MSTTTSHHAHETRARLVAAATRAFAEHGVDRASLLDITRQAGQRNRGAVHYHFGSRDGLLAAVLEPHVDFLAVREHELLDVARGLPGDLPSAIEVIVRPTTELAATGWSGRCFVMIVAELIAEETTEALAAVSELLARTGGVEAYDLIVDRLPPMPRTIRDERTTVMTAFALRAVADRARALENVQPEGGLTPQRREQLPDEAFVANLVAMVTAMLTAPLPPGSDEEV